MADVRPAEGLVIRSPSGLLGRSQWVQSTSCVPFGKAVLSFFCLSSVSLVFSDLSRTAVVRDKPRTAETLALKSARKRLCRFFTNTENNRCVWM